MPSLGHTFYIRCTLIPCDRSHSLGRRMTVDLPPRPTELRDVKSPPQRPPVDDSNEFAAFAAQLAARNESRRAGEASAAPPPGVDYEEDREEAASHSLSSRLAAHPVAAIGGGILLLAMVSVAVLVFRDLPFQASTPLPSNRNEQAKADLPAAGKRDVTVPPSVPAPPASPPTVTSPPPEPPQAAASAPAVTAPLPAAPPPAAKEPVKATPESPPSASQIPSASEPGSAPLTPDEIRELQGKLKAAGFNPGAIDGVVGPQTRSAMRTYAQSRSLQNAEATRDLLVRLNAEPPQQRPAQEPAVSSPASQSEASNSAVAAPAAERPEPRKTTCTADVGRWPTDRTDQAKAIQILLRDLGFFGGPTYGTVGPATRAAIRKFQLNAGETETGEPSEALFEQLKRKCASAP
jgi:peptidoglycan hydrolase-like protein with peptidoglycan-binding domain